MTVEADVYINGRNGGMTQQEYFELYDQLDAARARGDKKEYNRIGRLIPITADVARAFKTVYGREFIISCDFDVTEANMKFGEGWLDEDGVMEMNKNIDVEVGQELTYATSKASQTEIKLMQSTEVRLDEKAKEALARAILTATENAKSVEDLLHIERTFQILDKEKAVTAHDKASIESTERDYAQIAETVEQMRNSPEEYFKANKSLKETAGDFSTN